MAVLLLQVGISHDLLWVINTVVSRGDDTLTHINDREEMGLA